MPETWLFGASLWKATKALRLYEIVNVSLFLTGGAEVVNAQGSDKDWYLTSWTNGQVHQHLVMSSLIIVEVCEGFKVLLHSSFV